MAGDGPAYVCVPGVRCIAASKCNNESLNLLRHDACMPNSSRCLLAQNTSMRSRRYWVHESWAMPDDDVLRSTLPDNGARTHIAW